MTVTHAIKSNQMTQCLLVSHFLILTEESHIGIEGITTDEGHTANSAMQPWLDSDSNKSYSSDNITVVKVQETPTSCIATKRQESKKLEYQCPYYVTEKVHDQEVRNCDHQLYWKMGEKIIPEGRQKRGKNDERRWG